ncbi:hypothetical protein JCM8547_001201 [Rhodosporidiobolus lusitaniae]
MQQLPAALPSTSREPETSARTSFNSFPVDCLLLVIEYTQALDPLPGLDEMLPCLLTRPARSRTVNIANEPTTLASLGRVNKALHELCAPFLWDHVDLTRHSCESIAFFLDHLLPRYGKHIRTLVVGYSFSFREVTRREAAVVCRAKELQLEFDAHCNDDSQQLPPQEVKDVFLAKELALRITQPNLESALSLLRLASSSVRRLSVSFDPPFRTSRPRRPDRNTNAIRFAARLNRFTSLSVCHLHYPSLDLLDLLQHFPYWSCLVLDSGGYESYIRFTRVLSQLGARIENLRLEGKGVLHDLPSPLTPFPVPAVKELDVYDPRSDFLNPRLFTWTNLEAKQAVWDVTPDNELQVQIIRCEILMEGLKRGWEWELPELRKVDSGTAGHDRPIVALFGYRA